MRALPAAIAVIALLVSGCGGGDPPTTAPKATPPATSSATPPPPDVSGPYADAASAVREDSVYPDVGEPEVDALHYGIDVRWDEQRRRLAGTTAIRFRATATGDGVKLDLAPQLKPSRVRLDGAKVTFTHPGKDLLVSAPVVKDRLYTLEVAYAGKPEPAEAPTSRGDTPGLGWTTLPDGEVRAMQEPYGGFTWYPVNDQPADKAFYDVKIDAPGRWVGVSNGRLLSRSTKAGRTRTAWRLTHPAASYLVTIAIGPYQRYDDTGPHGLPISYWVRPRDKPLLRVVRVAPEAIGWLEDRLGPLPSDRMGFLIVPQASGMETQDMITLGRESIQQADGGQVVAHELAHQWYGDAVTPADWRDVWMNEGMATYLQAEWTVTHGAQTWDGWDTQFRSADNILRSRFGPPGAFKKDQFAQGNVYYSAALMWRVLHDKLGDATFSKLRKDWIQDHLYSNEDRDQLIAWWSKESGQDLTDFFTTWLLAEKTPSS
jgi:aminopeptidase N